ncbi:DUF2214 domain-containing protein [Paracraurococcus ruber]|uniref:DUF2214 domain-containing protein n=1 Tax=Paracraurococcus ruber TaxID=77675 RepID=A0ABS1D3R5_9PROT|nr:DUF2214 domain-containing protein [Paracraurococcus ruber]MBK1661482.1 hypothetical protein [Paracraurococcus ruber]TDG26863.1 DUF2214 domain-containing protein [Paracraurococcus ruber]
MPDAVLGALESLGLASRLARSAPLYALASGAHVLGIGLLLGPILLVDLCLLGVLRGLDPPALHLLRRAAALGAALAVGTGLLLFAVRPFEYAANPAMQWKLLLVALAVVHALAAEWRWRRRPAEPGQAAARVAGALSLLSWLGALALGRWVAFV